MKIEIKTGSYNEKRHGKPWIAIVDFTAKIDGEFSFGDWIGDARNGSAGLLKIDAEPGDVIARGQKDHRQPRNSAPDFFVVESSGALRGVSKVEAYQHAQARLAAIDAEMEAPAPEPVDHAARFASLLSRILQAHNAPPGATIGEAKLCPAFALEAEELLAAHAK